MLIRHISRRGEPLSAANRQLSQRGLRVLAFAACGLDDAAMSAAMADPMASVADLVLVALVGIMDPLRAEAKDVVRIAPAEEPPDDTGAPPPGRQEPLPPQPPAPRPG